MGSKPNPVSPCPSNTYELCSPDLARMASPAYLHIGQVGLAPQRCYHYSKLAYMLLYYSSNFPPVPTLSPRLLCPVNLLLPGVIESLPRIGNFKESSYSKYLRVS